MHHRPFRARTQPPHAPLRFELPDFACDAHCHVFGPSARFPFAQGRAYTPPDTEFSELVALQTG